MVNGNPGLKTNGWEARAPPVNRKCPSEGEEELTAVITGCGNGQPLASKDGDEGNPGSESSSMSD